jgi:hypothetical protein
MGSRVCFALALLLSTGCGSAQLRLTGSPNLSTYAEGPDGGSPGSHPTELRFRPGICESMPRWPEYGRLTEQDAIRFLERQDLDVRNERPRADLVYLVVSGAGTAHPIRLRVAILTSAEKAGRELHEALLQHGEGSWGVHRSNLAILGPVASHTDSVTFAARSKLACWGVFTVAGRDDTFVVPGAYTEL